MRSIVVTWAMVAGLVVVLVVTSGAQTGGSQKHKAVMMTRLYTGPDGQTHAEEVEAKFTPGSPNDILKLMTTAGAELRRSTPGTVQDWHTSPRRQYVITLSGQAELEVAGERFKQARGTLTWWKTPPAKVTLREPLATWTGYRWRSQFQTSPAVPRPRVAEAGRVNVIPKQQRTMIQMSQLIGPGVAA